MYSKTILRQKGNISLFQTGFNLWIPSRRNLDSLGHMLGQTKKWILMLSSALQISGSGSHIPFNHIVHLECTDFTSSVGRISFSPGGCQSLKFVLSGTSISTPLVLGDCTSTTLSLAHFLEVLIQSTYFSSANHKATIRRTFMGITSQESQDLQK